MKDRTTYAENIRNLRKKIHISQEEISARLGIKRGTYARYETDTVPPTSMLVKLSEIFNVSIDEICKGTDSYIDAIYSQPTARLRFSSSIGYNVSDEDSDPNVLTEEEEIYVLKFREASPESRKEIMELLDKK